MADAATAGATGSGPTKSSIKDMLISIVIAFAVAFVFRGFVVEPFQIPTGSMAPTLLGAHLRFDGPASGVSWPVGPWDMYDPMDTQSAKPVQGTPSRPVTVHDPQTGQDLRAVGLPLSSGDRIFVLKSLYSFMDPDRFDVVVFKFPGSPGENYIKRLVGLPNEQLAIVDGDIFTRDLADVPAGEKDPWSGPGWKIARKTGRARSAAWQPVFDSAHTPVNDPRFNPPWNGGEGWTITGARAYRYEGKGPTTLEWDDAARPICDAGYYNETFPQPFPLKPGVVIAGGDYQGGYAVFPVSDVRLDASVRPGTDGQSFGGTLTARGREFRFHADATACTIAWRAEGSGEAFTELARGATPAGAFRAGRVTDVEFSHADQELSVRIDAFPGVSARYEMTPAERVLAATGRTIEQILESEGSGHGFALAEPKTYRQPSLTLDFSAGPVTVERLSLERDLHYQTRFKGDHTPGAGTHPSTTVTLKPDQFFMCGDNSAASLDGRFWTSIDPWVEREVGPDLGVVHRDLLVGKAFVVYFPAPGHRGRVPVPDAGRLRFIW